MSIISELTVNPITTSNQSNNGQGFEQFLAAKSKIKQGKNDSQFWFDKSDADLKHIILSLANRIEPDTFSRSDVIKKFSDFNSDQRRLIILSINKFKSYSRKLPRYFSPYDADESRLRN